MRTSLHDIISISGFSNVGACAWHGIGTTRSGLGTLEQDDQFTVLGVGEEVHRNGCHWRERSTLHA